MMVIWVGIIVVVGVNWDRVLILVASEGFVSLSLMLWSFYRPVIGKTRFINSQAETKKSYI